MTKILRCKLCGKKPKIKNVINNGTIILSLSCCNEEVCISPKVINNGYLDEEDAIIMHWNIMNKKEKKINEPFIQKNSNIQ